MATDISDFDYTLPPGLIAQSPAEPRESAKLMVIHRVTEEREHAHIGDLPGYFRSGDVVVINNTKVFHARLHGTLATGARVELFLVRPSGINWIALGKPGKKLPPGTTIAVADNFTAEVLEKNPGGTLVVSFGMPADDVIRLADRYGEVPVPPYIKKIPSEDQYQTVYAKYVGSVAAPTAGFHLTQNILDQLRKSGVTVAEITLHVGLGTFLPVKSDILEEHTMHSEWAEIPQETADIIRAAKSEKRRIIAVGTTTVRTLEGVAALHEGTVIPFSGDLGLFITPGFPFRIIDAMLTNFHLPKSTLIVLVSAFAGRKTILSAYGDAVRRGYRFYSFGDAMLIF